MTVLACKAILFDLDGVLVDSSRCIDRVWKEWAAARGYQADRFIAQSKGRRTSETLRVLAPELDIAAEVALLDAMEERETDGLCAFAGAGALLSLLPGSAWGIVTSGSREVASLRLREAGLPAPEVFITGDQVRQGKPEPECYLLGAARLGADPADCLVVEDSPAGVAAGRSAGMQVLAVLTTHSADVLQAAHAIVPGLEQLRLSVAGGDLIVEVQHQA
ncbi:MAG TPA: HAD-IA family hydrolase [Gemmatimonadales bacterium]|nr:HAD-IA family hydrolase [Gemmatimonadales bacterium]